MSRSAGLVAFVAALGLVAALTCPTIVHPGSMARIDTSDGQFSVWNVAWVAHALVDDPAHLFDANIFYPHTGTLAYSEANLVAGALAAPVYALTRDPVAAYNVAVYAALVLAFVAMWALVRRLTGSPAAGLVSATLFAFAPYVSARTAHVQLLMVFVFPLVLLAFHRFVERPAVPRGAVLGLSLAVAALACGYYGIFAGLAVGLGVLWFLPRRSDRLRYVAGVLVAIAVAAALVWPVMRPYLALRQQAGFRSALNRDEAQSYSADWRAYLRSPAVAHRWLADRLGSSGANEVLFPGFLALGLAALGVVTAGRGAAGHPEAAAGRGRAGRRASDPLPAPPPVAFYLALVLLAVWASFGPAAGLYAWLARATPFMSFLRAPARFGVLVAFGVAVLAGFGAAALGRGARWVPAALVLVAAAELHAVWPLVPVPPLAEPYRVLAGLPRGGLLELHFPYKPSEFFLHARYMFWSMWHWQPLINGYSDYIPPDFREMAVPINYFPDERSLQILRDHRARYVLIHLDTYDPPQRALLLARFAPYQRDLKLLAATETMRLYEISYPEGFA